MPKTGNFNLDSLLRHALAGCALAVACCAGAAAMAQVAAVPAAAALPEPVYWKQDLFLVPYQWSSGVEPAAAQAVWLFVSKDHGANWRKVSEATPQVKAFNYRAEGDGEYWFAVQTIDRYGRAWPAGMHQPELRVVVDTTMPQISELRAKHLETGVIEVVCHGSDENLDASTWKIEAQLDAAGTWQSVAILPNAEQRDGNSSTIHTQWQPAAGVIPLAVRASVQDRAGNSAMFQCQIATAAASTLAGVPAEQSWPAAVTSRSPFRLSTSGGETAADGVTTYGTPPWLAGNSAAAPSDSSLDQPRLEARYAGPVAREPATAATPPAESTAPNAEIRPLEPFRQAAITRLPAPDRTARAHLPPPQPKLVGSRTFALEYDLEDAGGWGVSKVELWGTRDGGRTWRSYARDDDHRSPIVVTVDDEGVYGFRICVESAGAAAPRPPSAGDEPELWVSVDLRRPIIELTALERGAGNMADHLVLRWRAADDHLDARPISLFYSSRPGGPWSAIATNLEDTGEYAWRVERYVPARFYVRAEARDSAGNLAAFQTRLPVDFATIQPGGRLRDGDSNTAAGDASYR